MEVRQVIKLIEIIVTFITAGATIINTVISKKTSKKVETIQDIKEEFKNNLNSVKYENDKTYLTDFLSEIENGNKKSEIQIRRAYEVYEEYTKLNGNSYIRTEWERLKKENKI